MARGLRERARLHAAKPTSCRPHDTLYSIAWRHDLDYRELARWNHIGPDYRIAVGQVLMLKPGLPRSPARRANAVPSARPGACAEPAPSAALERRRSERRRAPTRESSVRRPEPGPPCAASRHAGAAAARIGCGPPRTRRRRVPSRAAASCCWARSASRFAPPAAGRVVYVGNGIRGYGNLIIIKHGDTVLSAYAHTVELTVREGQEVLRRASKSRSMGTGPHDIAGTVFRDSIERQAGRSAAVSSRSARLTSVKF